ncbi:hypothetical protein BD414DRAFT_413638 [Trametes punicea]|nr:hypothetical protein BD414DRAFT_413638 [Trametes punicea]
MAHPSAEWVPTVDDLKVKSCYICLEEERFDRPEDPPRAWTHPCSCTLVAHESCLLQWIKSAQQDSLLNKNALKCAQCGTQYELESDNPLILKVLNALNSLLSTAGQAATIVGFVSLTASFGFTIYVVSTSYGAFAVKEFLGENMFNILLTDDPGKWPWHAFIHLPMIPFSLVLSRTNIVDTLPLVPLLLTWATTPPIRNSSSTATIPSFSGGWSLSARGGTAAGFAPALNWPPTPLMAMVLFPVLRNLYCRAFDKLTKWVMGSATADTVRGRIRRVILAMNEDGPAPLRVRIGANIEPATEAGQRARQQRRGRDAGAANQLREGGADEEDARDDPAAAAERTLHVTTSSLGRFVGGALLVPTISKHMGALLFRLSKHSPLLRAFLAIRDHPATPPAAVRIQLFNRPPNNDVGLLRQIGSGLVAGINILCSGTATWNEHDPVWWRNAVGLGLFVFTKDCIRLLHLWLTKRELESRRVKNRPFAGVDPQWLNLIRGPPTASAQDEQSQPAPKGPADACGDT